MTSLRILTIIQHGFYICSICIIIFAGGNCNEPITSRSMLILKFYNSFLKFGEPAIM